MLEQKKRIPYQVPYYSEFFLFFIYAGAGPSNRLRNTASDNLFINVDQRCGDGAALFGRSREKGAAPAPALRLKLQLWPYVYRKEINKMFNNNVKEN